MDDGRSPAIDGRSPLDAVEEDEILSVRRFRVTVAGQTYEVEVEEIDRQTAGSSTPAATTTPATLAVSPVTPTTPSTGAAGQSPAPSPAPAPAATPSSNAGSTAAESAAGTKVTAPLPGVVLEVRVKQGDTVQEGQVVAILEAMKMENEIAAPTAGTVVAVTVEPGNTVDQGETLVVIGNG